MVGPSIVLLTIALKPHAFLILHYMFQQESRAVAREPRDAAITVVFGSKFADNIHYKFKSSQASKARLQSSKRTGAKQNLTQSGHCSRSRLHVGVSGKAIRD